MLLNNNSSFYALPKKAPASLDEPLRGLRFFNLINMQKEIWKDIPGYEGLYQVSNFGNVKSLSRVISKNRFKTNYLWPLKEKLLKQVTDKNNYKHVRLFNNDNGKKYKVHRLVMLAFVGNSNLHVNHKDFNTSNNKISNLEYLSCKENVNHYWDNCNKTNAIKVHDTFTNITYRSITEATIAYCKENNLSVSVGNNKTLKRNTNNRWVFLK